MAYAENQVTLEVVSDGSDGVGVSSIQPQYYLSTSSSSATGGSWSNTLTYESGKYIWTRDEVTLSNGTVTHSTAIYNQALTNANEKSESAITLAEAVDDHFWYDNTGAHITKITQEDYQDDPSSAGGNTLITSDGMAVRDGETELAVFTGSGAQIGQDNEPRVEIQPSGIDFYADNNIPVGTIGQSETVQRSMTVEEKFFDDDGVQEDQTLVVSLPYAPTGNQIELGIVASRIMGSHAVTSLDYSEYINYTNGATTTMRLTTPADYGGGDFGLTITATVSTTNRTVTFVFARDSSSYYLVMCQADVTFSHYWRAPHFIFGDQTQAKTAGQCSVAMNATEAAGDYQTTVGKYNMVDDNNQYAFIVGKGTDVANKSNALTVDWNGNVESYGNITDGNGNTLSTIASATNSKLKNITVKGISKSFYIGAGTSTSATTKDISFTSTELEGGSIYNAYVCLGTYQLPYFNVANKLFTWVSSVTSNTITISNSATAWGSSSNPYTAYCVLFLIGTT